jgi:hypothetical protein
MKSVIKHFSAEDIKNSNLVIATVIVTIVPYWDGKKEIKKSYINYQVLGLNWDQEQSYDYIIAYHGELLKVAQQYAKDNSDTIWIQ